MKRGTSASGYERVKKHRYVVGKASDSNSADSDSERGLTENCETERASGEVTERTSPEKEYFESVSPHEDVDFSHENDTSSKSSSDLTKDEIYEPNSGLVANLPIEDDNQSYHSDDDYYSCDSCTDSDDSVFSEEEETTEQYPTSNNPIEDLKGGLRLWSLRNRITLKALSELLIFLLFWITTHCTFLHQWSSSLPKDARTLLGTTKAGKKYKTRPMPSQGGKFGEFVYFGLKDTLEQVVDQKYFPSPLIGLHINVDGLPLYKSSSTTFWPIMAKIFDQTYKWRPFPVAVYCGPGKPNDVCDFFSEFVEETEILLRDGVVVKGHHYQIQIICYCCDTPARAFVKCVVGHGGFFCCERCEVKGITVNHKRVYPDNNCTIRTEESFLNKTQEEHHTGTSPLTRIPGFQPIKTFVLDFMHLICLGVMKRLLVFYWVGLNKKQPTSLSARCVSALSKRLNDIKKDIPREFCRKTRGLDEVARFKATEYRFFVLYCGPVVLKDILDTKLYKHFLLLHTATRILCCPESCSSLADYAKSLYRHFFDFLPDYYGADSQITNMHNVIHLADDVSNFGCTLDMLSAFDFENELGKMKRMLRSPYKPLAQYCRRKYELGALPPPTKRFTLNPIVRRVSRGDTALVVDLLDFKLSSQEPDNFVLLKNGSVFEIFQILMENKQVTIQGRIWEMTDIFLYPCQSSKLNEWEIKNPSKTESLWKIEDVKAKLVRLRQHQQGHELNYALAVLH